MKIYSKSIRKLIVIQYYNEFNKAIKYVSEDNEFRNKINVLNREGINQIYLPKEFESILHRNIIINVNENGDGIDVMARLNNDQIFKGLCQAFDKKFKEEGILKQELLKTANAIKSEFVKNKNWGIDLDDSVSVISTEKSKQLSSFTCFLLVKTWPIIVQYFPFEEYGFPTKNFYNNLFSLILGDYIVPESEVYFHENHDVYGLEIILENEILKEILNDYDIDFQCVRFKPPTFSRSAFSVKVKKALALQRI